MRKNKQLWYPLFKLLLVVGVAAGLFFWLRPSEEKRIRKQFQRLSEAIAKSGDEGNASAAVNAGAGQSPRAVDVTSGFPRRRVSETRQHGFTFELLPPHRGEFPLDHAR